MMVYFIFGCYLSFLSFFLFSPASASSNIGTFRDSTCSKSLDNYSGPNGYPDGTCTALHLSPEQSFSVVGLDRGCSVTIYGPNTNPSLPCSSDTKIVAQLAQCYNSSWIYYSIDGCDIPSTLTTSATPITLPAETSTPTSAIASSTPDSQTSNGVVIGAVIGSVTLFASVFILLLYLLRRHYIRSKSKPSGSPRSKLDRDLPPPPPAYELSEEQALQELEYGKSIEAELYAHEHAAEMGRNSKFGEAAAEMGRNSKLGEAAPAVELEGDMLAEYDKKGFNPGIRVHLVP